MIYLDTSVVLAQLLAEDLRPHPAIWEQPLVSSRLLEYEIWVRLHARKLAATHGDSARALLQHISLLELTPVVLARALDPFPLPVRTLHALHLASISYLRERRVDVRLAAFDERLLAAARRMKIPVIDPRRSPRLLARRRR